MHNTVMSSSEKHTWETPIDFFNKVNDFYNFNLDSCAEDSTAKCKMYFTKEDDALTKDWIGVVWCNPPYGREQKIFIEKVLNEVNIGNAKTVVCLIPSRTETKIWQDVIFNNATSVHFIKGRLRFGDSKENAPFPSALVVFGECVGDIGVGKYFYLGEN